MAKNGVFLPDQALKVGDTVVIPVLGICLIESVRDSGACAVVDPDGKRWLVAKPDPAGYTEAELADA